MKKKKISKKVVKKFKDVTEKLKMLQISEDAICDAILELEGRACFIDYDEEINDIYSGPVLVIFVMNWNQNKLHYLQVLATFKRTRDSSIKI
jgi:hypothetical protein